MAYPSSKIHSRAGLGRSQLVVVAVLAVASAFALMRSSWDEARRPSDRDGSDLLVEHPTPCPTTTAHEQTHEGVGAAITSADNCDWPPTVSDLAWLQEISCSIEARRKLTELASLEQLASLGDPATTEALAWLLGSHHSEIVRGIAAWLLSASPLTFTQEILRSALLEQVESLVDRGFLTRALIYGIARHTATPEVRTHSIIREELQLWLYALDAGSPEATDGSPSEISLPGQQLRFRLLRPSWLVEDITDRSLLIEAADRFSSITRKAAVDALAPSAEYNDVEAAFTQWIANSTTPQEASWLLGALYQGSQTPAAGRAICAVFSNPNADHDTFELAVQMTSELLEEEMDSTFRAQYDLIAHSTGKAVLLSSLSPPLSPESRQLILRESYSSDSEVRAAAIARLSQLGTPEALNHVRRGLEDPAPSVRKRALRSMLATHIVPESIESYWLARMSCDPDDGVRELARQVLNFRTAGRK